MPTLTLVSLLSPWRFQRGASTIRSHPSLFTAPPCRRTAKPPQAMPPNMVSRSLCPKQRSTPLPLVLQLLTLIILLHFSSPGQAANPVAAPIVQSNLFVHTRPFAQLPSGFDGKPARIICIVPHRKALYVCDSTRIYRVDGRGRVRLFLDVRAAIKTATRNKRSLSLRSVTHGGVRSIAFHPKYSNQKNRRFYISAMETRPRNPQDFKYISDVANHIAADSVLLEFRATSRHVPIVRSYRCVFRVGMPKFDHTIRQIAFRHGMLYISHGDGSEQSATVGGGQNSDARGKILRIIPLKRGSQPYTIPSNNPFRRSRKMIPEVWALGFRNPHHLCFGRDGTLYVADAGRANIEEVNIVKKGGNYGWSLREGTFVHAGGGLLSGVKKLPKNDAKFGFTYPAAQVGHEGRVGQGWVGQAIAGACPIENGSPMSSRYYYSDFPFTGKLYFSRISELKRAVTKGNPARLRQATTFQAKICFYKNAGGPARRFNSLGDAMRSENGNARKKRVDVRFGIGWRGELYWASKATGRVYVFLSSLKGGPSNRC